MKWISHVEWSGVEWKGSRLKLRAEYFTSVHLDAYFEVKVWSRIHFYLRKWKYLELK